MDNAMEITNFFFIVISCWDCFKLENTKKWDKAWMKHELYSELIMIIANDDFLLLTIVTVATLIVNIIASFEYNYHSLDLAVYILDSWFAMNFIFTNSE